MSAARVAGRYTLVRQVGRGGMGAVWLARDEVLGRDVAMKTLGLFPGSETPDLARARREATLAAALSHPNIVTVFDLAAEGDERWLVMEYVPGTTLAHYAAERGGLSPAETVRVVRQAAEALRVAHDAGIVHRDVKPSNLMVAPDGTVKLTDFGIARSDGDLTLTHAGTLTGSPAYLAPEVAGGGAATPASDVWSLGATAFQALTGRPPYPMGDNVLAGLVRVVSDPPPRLPGAGPLATLLEHTMVHDPRRRWTAAQVAAFLAAVDPRDLPEAVTVPLPAAPPPAWRPDAPSPQPTDTVTVVRRPPVPRWPLAALAVVVALVLSAWLLGRSAQPTDRPAAEASTPGAATASPGSDPSASPPATRATAAAAPTASGMRSFIERYLRTVTSDRRAAFGMLTPAFQTASGGYGSYAGFWGPIRSATASQVRADPETLRIRYHVRYDGPRNRPASDDVELQLAFTEGRYRIAGEA